jgi:leucyl-tRNA synthetase
MRDEGLLECDEPFEQLLCQGMVLAETYFKKNDDGSTQWFNPADVTVEKDDKGKPLSAFLTANNQPVEIGGTTKMSKSKNNGIDPQTTVDLYGADTVRLFTMFASPPTQTLEWNDAGVEGGSRFLRRLWKTVHAHLQASAHLGDLVTLDEPVIKALAQEQKDLRRKTHETIEKVSGDYGVRQQFNTAIAAVMELMNDVNKHADRSTAESLAVEHEALEAAILLLAPVVPHICHSLWIALGHDSNVIDEVWPSVDQAALVKAAITLVIQVNGKVRAKLEAPNNTPKNELEAIALDNEQVKQFIADKTVRKVIVVPNKLVNIVAN